MTTKELRIPKENGTEYEKYKFTQTLNEVSVIIKYPTQIRGKDINCKMTNDSLLVQIKGETFINGKLHKMIKKSDSCWTIEDKTTLVIDMVKKQGMEWWSCVIVGDDEIDIKKIKGEEVTDINDFDDDTRDVVQQMLFDQHQQQQGLPTMDELKRNKIMEDFMKQHPEMDFSETKFMN